ncbi:hypothetical protein [Staphylococcus aureus]|nr:hypothetical protein [Staphylococcus aureus]
MKTGQWRTELGKLKDSCLMVGRYQIRFNGPYRRQRHIGIKDSIITDN